MVSSRGAVEFFLIPSFFALSLAQPFGTSKLQWGPCNETEVPSDVPVECSVLYVPLDYTEPNSNETLPLDLVKVLSPVKPSRGSILFNFGGPGEPSRSVIGGQTLAENLFALTDRQFDLVTFDPRGTSGSKIPMNCFEVESDAWSFLYDISVGNQSEVELGRQWARGKMLADACLRTQNKTGSLLSSAFVARDMIQIVDALQEDGLLRYWGFSYGTTLGATAAAMFPDRVEKMILDGVQNPHDYYHEQANFQEWTDSDAEFSAIFTGCVANRDNCALATGNNKTAAELEQEVWDLLDTVKYHPLFARNYLLDYNNLKSYLVQQLYGSAGWPAGAVFINFILTGQLDTVADVLDATGQANVTDPFATLSLYQALAGIYCGDNQVRTEKFEDFLPAVERLYSTSRILGDGAIGVASACQQWKIEPKERYTGDFNVKTKSPVLFIGNTFDGLTPLVSAKNVSSTFEGSALLTVNGYGHSSLAVPSACTLRTTSAYWSNGTLPAEGMVCEAHFPLFSPGASWVDPINEVYGNGTATAKRDVSHLHGFRRSLAPLPLKW
ncbi:alpha/beta-hydrolase [Hypoxylon rubiginosum]|uniref:Alpha/beta-hydrolase n=1 Tax=Hypoxylon rubiginosum TaxID=110542 RepID=A0ACB9YPA1_9PEZI|nr:alpha/beta-hydrolase [Hypoxylon rubiginosum]